MPKLRKYLLDILFPRHCLGCDVLLNDESQSYICRPCLKAISLNKGFACAFCKSPVKNGKTCVYCVQIHYLDRLLVAASYENPLVEKILKTVKYRFVRLLAEDMYGLMVKYLKRSAAWLTENGSIWVVPVPLHRRRFNWRGFNQAEIMACGIGNIFGWPVTAEALRRRRNHKPQADMKDRLSRIENTRNIFELNPAYTNGANVKNGLTGKTVLLIDDVSTTGSTLDDCARALKGAGAKEVIGFVFARNKS